MTDTSVATLKLLPGVPARGTLTPGTPVPADGLTFTTLLSTEIAQLGTTAVSTGDELLDPDSSVDESGQAATTNPIALLLGGVLQPPPVAVTAVPSSGGGDASRVETLRFSGPINRTSAAASDVILPQGPHTPVSNSGQTLPQPAASALPAAPLNTSLTAALATQVPPASRVVVPQTPVVIDRTQVPPPPPVELRPVPVQSPVGEPEPVTGPTPVSAEQQPTITQQRTNVPPQTPPPGNTYPDAEKQAAVAPNQPARTGIAQPADVGQPRIDSEAGPATTSGGFMSDLVKPSSTAFEPERKSVAADSAAAEAMRIQPHTTHPTAQSDRTAADARAVATPATQISDTWITHADVRAKDGGHEFHLRLDPPELGEVRVRVHSSADGVRAELTVTSDAVRAMIESQIPELRQRLQDGGVTVSQFDVTTNTPGGDSSARNPYREPPPREARPDPAAVPASPARTRDPTAPVGGLLDVTA